MSGEVPAGTRTAAIVRWALVVGLGLAAAVSIASYFAERAQNAPAQGEQLYVCPMHPQIVRDRPGECPICGMTLVPKPRDTRPPTQDGGVPGLAAVTLSPERIQLSGLRTAAVRRAPLGGSLRATGVISPDERGLAQINLRFSGYVETLQVSETGQRVRRGQVLATIYSPEVLRVEQELITALGWKPSTEGDHHALTRSLDQDARRRLELLGIAPQEIAELLRGGEPRSAVAVRSPVDGYVITKNAVAGASVQPGSPLFEVADLATVWVLAEIPESELARVRVGQTARVSVAAYPGATFPGKVQLVYPTVDATTRTLRVRVALRNPVGENGPKLRPGMYGTVTLDLPAAPTLLVPTESLVDTGEAQYVFVALAGGRFEPRRVKRGASDSSDVEILSGLKEGETVVTTANFFLDSESRLQSTIGAR